MSRETSQFIRIAKAIEYLYDHADEQPSLEMAAAQVHLSPEHFLRQFQAWAGVSPKKFLQYISVERAKQVLQNQGNMQEATFAGGLSSAGRLHDLFVSLEGMTPGEYKSGGAGLRIDYGCYPTPLGEVLIGATARGVCFMSFADGDSDAVNALKQEFPRADLRRQENPLHRQALAVLVPDGSQTAVPLHLKGTPFQLKVWQALLTIPAGQLSSYGDIAKHIGQPDAARAVGAAVGANPVAVLIPCHRVIRQSGVIGGYRWQRGRKMALLAQEIGAGNG
ncbi:AraC family transcriptional regulator, regulatory protein of adaptative response / methylated-DNA-[protein]-cysteine methyltransferase [Pasteurella testudinis DSM 23072]|uniref:methylated-DNA--[protein]-cysteine S-methyltransferase n=1 Tax=Pasteurella testudinis DSM 23072 TaxID=1122938 RepID=A0A1W1V7F3_9PAST|nr:methylated-DNA--[protein]-cysteine S-methyltransferase [Pasteurella testudinis]SMB89130.1 AraC family transcriptional regulator, regulatory protein of adaptative response / methylated-DNA-[protein]-cysteine methyltransferase [Pasteurella testudinis DSM 23072]SUB50193.1 methylated-DNA--protein-cysteine methyltransferase [Pasteurella testudinis]